MQQIDLKTHHFPSLDLIHERLGRSEMSPLDREFLSWLLEKHKPMKVLELGVAAGASAAIILGAIQSRPSARLFSVDYSTPYYRDKSKNSGYLVPEKFPEFLPQWTLRTGKLAAAFMDEIGSGIDFCLIDTMHSNPGEILDFLMVLPYLNEGCVVVFHDIALHTAAEYRNSWTNGMLFGMIRGDKFAPVFEPEKDLCGTGVSIPFPNIGALVLNAQTRREIFDVFYALTLPWRYRVSEGEIGMLTRHFGRFYDAAHVALFQKAAAVNNAYLSEHARVVAGSRATLWRYRILSRVTFGKKRRGYQAKKKALRKHLKKGG